MTITAIEPAALPQASFEPASLLATSAAATASTSAAPAAGEMFAQLMSQVNQEVVGSQSGIQSLALGDAQNLHQVMIRLEEAKLGFQLLVQVRNRMLEAYQEVMKTQI